MRSAHQIDSPHKQLYSRSAWLNVTFVCRAFSYCMLQQPPPPPAGDLDPVPVRITFFICSSKILTTSVKPGLFSGSLCQHCSTMLFSAYKAAVIQGAACQKNLGVQHLQDLTSSTEGLRCNFCWLCVTKEMPS